MDIKPLKWKNARRWANYDYWLATTPISEYTVSSMKPDEGEVIVSLVAFRNGSEHGIGESDSRKFSTVDDAIMYAEKSHAKHVAKILKKLVTE